MTTEYSSSAPRPNTDQLDGPPQGGSRGGGAGGGRFGRGGGGGGGRPGGGGGRPGGGGRRFGRRRVCMFCVDKMHRVDYKNLELLRRYLADSAKIESSRKSGTCMKHQRVLRRALLRARHLAMLPYADNHLKMTGPVAARQEAPPAPEPEPSEETPDDAAGAISAESGDAVAASPESDEATAETTDEASGEESADEASDDDESADDDESESDDDESADD
ncbi:MAG TPA: 30S ribosomal protein S18, partial [Dehalococcoidia bacterium]|nr:30S ribosomal protein S18 [Dehalococcoidia bacterium]